MRRPQLCLLLVLATAGGLVGFCPLVFGSSIGFHEWQKHEHSDLLALPRLYEPVPEHVPTLSNAALIRLWEQNQYSPILRNAQIEIQLCEAIVAHRDLNPTRFDFYHPTLGHMLRDPSFFEYALSLYRSHTARFVHYHHELIPVIRGCALLMQQHPTRGVSGETLQPPLEVSPPPGGGSFTPIVPPLSVPAPPSILLLLIGMGYVGRRLRREFTKRSSVP